MLWQVESDTGSQLMFDDITAGLASMSVRRKDLEKELDSHVTEVAIRRIVLLCSLLFNA